MKQRPRIYYTEEQKALMWDRWQKGESLQTIAQLFDRNHSSVAGVLSRTVCVIEAWPRYAWRDRVSISTVAATGTIMNRGV